MKTLSRLILLALSVALVASVFAMYTNTTEVSVGHDTFYHFKWPWLHDVRQVSLFGVLVWCLLFVRREPAFVRVGLVALILSFTIMALPPKILKEPVRIPSWH